jgi:peptide-methionine (S)-S-oxide reductase
MTQERAVLAGGCFWGMEELLRHQRGVVHTQVGYTGGTFPNPTYEDMKRGTTGHAEAVEVLYDATILSYKALLALFFSLHDPTTKDRQGNDRGTSYRSAIFTLSEAQRTVAHEVIAQLNVAQIWNAPIVTEITDASIFYPAELYHQNYLQRIPDGYTCHWIRPEWRKRIEHVLQETSEGE